mmetsp:Transcript_4853/g.12683  ORF Transcript_4853/g.12683 Transcript_4853/m.12683 type:complete len:238 (-) Transcript_4853:96-809(-)
MHGRTEASVRPSFAEIADVHAETAGCPTSHGRPRPVRFLDLQAWCLCVDGEYCQDSVVAVSSSREHPFVGARLTCGIVQWTQQSRWSPKVLVKKVLFEPKRLGEHRHEASCKRRHFVVVCLHDTSPVDESQFLLVRPVVGSSERQANFVLLRLSSDVVSFLGVATFRRRRVKRLLAHWRPSSVIVVLQNGLFQVDGEREELARRVEHGVDRLSGNAVVRDVEESARLARVSDGCSND